ncbi:C-factor [Rhypophila sp. PSN 637]
MPVYCITGANRGIGLEFVRQLATSPNNTILALTRSLLSDLTDLKGARSSSTHILECDVGDIASIQAFAHQASKLLLGKDQKIDFLVNNAGINGTSAQNTLSLDPEGLLSQIKINVLGPAKTAEFLLGQNLLADDVRVLNLTSGLASLEMTSEGPRKAAGYSISKAALNMLTVHQGVDLRDRLPGAVVIVMDPGWVKTRLGGHGAALEPHESVEGMLHVLHGLKDEDNCAFFHHSGKKLPW